MNNDLSEIDEGRSPGRWIALVVGACVLLALLIVLVLPAIQHARTPVSRNVCASSLKQIGVALHTYHDQHGCFPPVCTYDKDGKPMHSWRMLLLPYFEHHEFSSLAKAYRLNEPWNSPHNWRVIEAIGPEAAPYVYRCRMTESDPFETNYVAIEGNETAWPTAKQRRIHDITDGTSRTICLAEIQHSGIHWAEPRDLPVDQALLGINPPHVKFAISSRHPDGANFLFCDGSVHFLTNHLSGETLRALLTANGGENVEIPED